MKISDDSLDKIVDEFNYVAKEMQATDDPFKKMFLFSATYGIIQRLINVEYDPHLIYIHLVLQTTYERINSRLNSLVSGMDKAIDFPDVIFDKLPDIVIQLAEQIHSCSQIGINNKLEEIATLSYLTTGNGYYLFQKGLLKV